MVLFYFLMDISRRSPRRIPTEGKEFQMPDMRFHYGADQLYALFEQAGEERPRMRRYWLLDFGFIVCFWGVMISIDLNVDGPATRLYLIMFVLATLRALLDLTENILLLRVYRSYPARRNGLASAAGYVTSAKFVCLYGWVALLFYKLFFAAFGIGR